MKNHIEKIQALRQENIKNFDLLFKSIVEDALSVGQYD